MDRLCRLLWLAYLAHMAAGHNLVRLCRGTAIDVLGSKGVRIEAHIDSRAQIDVWDKSLTNNTMFEVEFEFKTSSLNGILMYGKVKGDKEDMIAIYLERGLIFYKIFCPTMNAEIYVPTNVLRQKLNDDKWHKITYKTQFRNHLFQSLVGIDGYARLPRRIGVSCAHVSTIEMGGYSLHDDDHVSKLQDKVGLFEGCIRRLNISRPLRSPPKYYFVSGC